MSAQKNRNRGYVAPCTVGGDPEHIPIHQDPSCVQEQPCHNFLLFHVQVKYLCPNLIALVFLLSTFWLVFNLRCQPFTLRLLICHYFSPKWVGPKLVQGKGPDTVKVGKEPLLWIGCGCLLPICSFELHHSSLLLWHCPPIQLIRQQQPVHMAKEAELWSKLWVCFLHTTQLPGSIGPGQRQAAKDVLSPL